MSLIRMTRYVRSWSTWCQVFKKMPFQVWWTVGKDMSAPPDPHVCLILWHIAQKFHSTCFYSYINASDSTDCLWFQLWGACDPVTKRNINMEWYLMWGSRKHVSWTHFVCIVDYSVCHVKEENYIFQHVQYVFNKMFLHFSDHRWSDDKSAWT